MSSSSPRSRLESKPTDSSITNLSVEKRRRKKENKEEEETKLSATDRSYSLRFSWSYFSTCQLFSSFSIFKKNFLKYFSQIVADDTHLKLLPHRVSGFAELPIVKHGPSDSGQPMQSHTLAVSIPRFDGFTFRIARTVVVLGSKTELAPFVGGIWASPVISHTDKNDCFPFHCFFTSLVYW